MNSPLVSIGIPTFNRADGFLIDAINSATRQTYSNIEIIIGDNCSEDHTESLVQSIGDPRIHYFRHDQNIGPENNFNFCLDQAKGHYFLLLHDDDLIDKDYIETCLQAADYQPHFGFIRTGIRVIDENGAILRERENRTLGDTFEDKMMSWFTHQSPWYLCNTLFNTQKLKEIDGFRSKRKLLQDGVAVTKLCARFPTIDVEPVKASIRKHHGEITFAVRVTDWAEDFLELLDLMVELAPNDKAMIRTEGHRFFANLSNGRASAVKSRRLRWLAYFNVWRLFNYKYMPPPVRYLFDRVSSLKRTADTNRTNP